MASPTLSRHTTASATATTNSDIAGHSATSSGRGRQGSGRPRAHRQRSQVRVQWLILAAALTVLAGLLVAWALDRAADRVDVISVARPVPAGAVIEAADLTTTAIAFDAPVTGLAPATSLDALVGRVATVDLEPGALLSTAMWADGTELSAGERTVGALLAVGTHPSGLTSGTNALAVSIDGATDDDSATAAGVAVRVIDASADDRGSLRVTLAVPADDATRIARLAAADMLVLVGVPPASAGQGDGQVDGQVDGTAEASP